MTLSTTAETPILARPGVPRAAAATAAVLLGIDGVVGLVATEAQLSDHMTGPGRLSELVVGLAFVAGAVALALLTPVSGWRRVLWWVAPAGLGIAGVTMVAVPVLGEEPAEWLFAVAVLPTFVGLVAAGILGRGRVWPWWTGAGVALLIPIMFTLPFNGFLMGAVWAMVAVTGRRSRTAGPESQMA